MGNFDKYWEMTEGGPYDEGEEVYKCKGCGAVTFPDKGWNGEPDPDLCSEKCRDGHRDWKPGSISNTYRKHFDRIFPDAPGAGI